MLTQKLHSRSGLTRTETLILVGIVALVALILAILCLVPVEDGRHSIDSADLDNARELALVDCVTENGARGKYSPSGDNYTYYFAPNVEEIGVHISQTPEIRGRSLENRRKTIIVIVAKSGEVQFAEWTAVPEG